VLLCPDAGAAIASIGTSSKERAGEKRARGLGMGKVIFCPGLAGFDTSKGDGCFLMGYEEQQKVALGLHCCAARPHS